MPRPADKPYSFSEFPMCVYNLDDPDGPAVVCDSPEQLYELTNGGRWSESPAGEAIEWETPESEDASNETPEDPAQPAEASAPTPAPVAPEGDQPETSDAESPGDEDDIAEDTEPVDQDPA